MLLLFNDNNYKGQQDCKRNSACFKILAFDSWDTFFGHPYLSTVIIFTVDMTNIKNIINKHN